MSARPYPAELEEEVLLPSGRQLTLRPIHPDDEAAHLDLLRHLSLEDSRWRFFATIKDMDHDRISRFTCIDYDREMAFIATDQKAKNGPATVGVVRAAILNDEEAEFAIVVRSDDKHHGVGHALMVKMCHYLHERGLLRVVGDVLPDNHKMLAFVRDLGFHSRFKPDEGVTKIWKDFGEQETGG